MLEKLKSKIKAYVDIQIDKRINEFSKEMDTKFADVSISLDNIAARMAQDDLTTQSLLKSQKLTDQLKERLDGNDLTMQSLLKSQKLTDQLKERLDSNDLTMQSLLKSQKLTDQLKERLDSNDLTMQSLLKTQKIVDGIIERLNNDDITTNSLIKTQVEFDKLKADYASIKLKLFLRTEILADNMLTLSEDVYKDSPENLLYCDFWNEGDFTMYDKKTYSQTGEDSIIAHIVAYAGIPFNMCNYLDLGANHPKEMSNTYFFYTQGASGVLVEANPTLAEKLKVVRSRDIVLNNCVSGRSGEYLDFTILNTDGLSSLGDVSDILAENPNARIERVIPIESISVNDIISQYFEKAPVIMNVDIEGMEMEILSSIDFDKFRPLVIIAEMIPYRTSLVIDDKNIEIKDFLEKNEYTEYAFTGINSIFVDKKYFNMEVSVNGNQH